MHDVLRPRTWLYLANAAAVGIEATRSLAREGGLWTPGPRLPAPDPGLRPGDTLVLLWRAKGSDRTATLLGAGTLAAPRSVWGDRPWIETVPPNDPLFQRSAELGYGGPSNYRAMARLEGWTEDTAGICRLAGPHWPRRAPGDVVGPLPAGALIVELLAGLLGQVVERIRPEDPLERIVIDPRVLHGKPILRGTRIAVEHVLGWLAGGATVAEIVADFPELDASDVSACLRYAERVLRNERVEPALGAS